jgi:hypothetical protein
MCQEAEIALARLLGAASDPKQISLNRTVNAPEFYLLNVGFSP